MFVNCGWELNWKKKKMILTLGGQSQWLSCAPEKHKVSSTGFQHMTSAMLVRCSNQLSDEPTQMWRCQFVGLICSLLTSEWLYSSVENSTAPSLQRSWIPISLKTPEIFNVHIILWDKCWDCSASVRIISSIQLTRIIRPFKEAEKWK